MNLLDINYTLVKLLGHPVSFIEIAGTFSGMLCVYLTAREKVICWPVGIVNIIFFFIMFYQVRLYSDMILQVYFLIMSVYGWWKWTHPKNRQEANNKNELKVADLLWRDLLVITLVSFVLTLLLGWGMQHVHYYLPAVFPEKAAYPYADAFTTVLSITATILMAVKKRECWLFWIAVDIVATTVYFLKGIHLVAVEYIIFGIISLCGYINWSRQMKKYNPAEVKI